MSPSRTSEQPESQTPEPEGQTATATQEAGPSPEQLEAERLAAEAEAQARAAHVQAVKDLLTPVMSNRVRLTFSDRKMSVPGKLSVDPDTGHIILNTNWGLELDTTDETITKVEVKELDSGRFVEHKQSAPAAQSN